MRAVAWHSTSLHLVDRKHWREPSPSSALLPLPPSPSASSEAESAPSKQQESEAGSVASKQEQWCWCCMKDFSTQANGKHYGAAMLQAELTPTLMPYMRSPILQMEEAMHEELSKRQRARSAAEATNCTAFVLLPHCTDRDSNSRPLCQAGEG